MNLLRKCGECGYTLNDKCPKCGLQTRVAHPPRFLEKFLKFRKS